MKALLTAGGRATRMRPITYTKNKHLIPLANRPMLWYAIEKIVDAGIREIFINVNPGETEIQKNVGDGSRWGASISYIEQKGGPKGLGCVISNAQPHIGNEPFLFYLGDNIILGSIREFVDAFHDEGVDAMLALSKVNDPQRFGVPIIENGRIVRVLEKPEKPPSPYAVTGMYVYSPRVFEAAAAIQPSSRGEYEISDIHTWLIENGATVGYREVTGWWKDTGKPQDLLEGNALILDQLVRTPRQEGEIHADATVTGRVSLGMGSKIDKGCTVRGPVVIGNNTIVQNSCIGPYTSIGDEVILRDAEIEHSLIMKGTHITTGARIVDAIVGENARVRSSKETRPSGHKLVIGDDALVEL